MALRSKLLDEKVRKRNAEESKEQCICFKKTKCCNCGKKA